MTFPSVLISRHATANGHAVPSAVVGGASQCKSPQQTNEVLYYTFLKIIVALKAYDQW
jgi:hypothetical protein